MERREAFFVMWLGEREIEQIGKRTVLCPLGVESGGGVCVWWCGVVLWRRRKVGPMKDTSCTVNQ